MTVESANFLSELDDTAPAGGDNISEGDNHLRLLKSVLQTTFPNADKPFNFPSIVDLSSNTSLVVADANSLVRMDASGALRTITLPVAGTLESGDFFDIVKIDDSTNAVNVGPAAGTIEGQAFIVLSHQFQCVRFMWNGTAWNTTQRNVGLWLAQRPVTAATVLTYASLGRLHYVGNSGDEFTVTLPTAVGYDGATIGFKHVGTTGSDITLNAAGAQTIDGETTLVLSQNSETIWLVSYGGNWRSYAYNLGAFSPTQENTWTAVQTLDEASLIESEQTLTVVSGDVDWDLALGNHAKLVVGEDVEFNAPSNKVVGQTGLLRLIGDFDGCELTWNAHFVWLTSEVANMDDGDIVVLSYFVASSTVVYLWEEVVSQLSNDYTDYTLASPYTSGQTYTQAHGLGELPTRIDLFLKCLTADGDFEVDDYIPLEGLWTVNSDGDVGATLATALMNDTNVKVFTAPGTGVGQIKRGWNSGGSMLTLTLANYALILRVFN